MPRTELDARIRDVALDSGAVPLEGARAVDVERDGDRVTAVVFRRPDGSTTTVRCRRLVVADGARSPLGRVLGREWHRDTAYGVAARGYIRSGRSDDEWISSHLELRGAEGELLSGYGWVFPLGDGEVNVGVGTLATDKPTGRRAAAQPARPLRRPAPRRVAASTAPSAPRPVRCCPWAVRCPGSRDGTGRWSATPPAA